MNMSQRTPPMNDHPSTTLPWSEDDVYAAVHAATIDAALGAGACDPATLPPMLIEQAAFAQITRAYRQGRDILDAARLICSAPFATADAQILAAFVAGAALQSPVVVIDCAPGAAVPVYRYAALVQRTPEPSTTAEAEARPIAPGERS
jgi:hypothetical protein